MNKGIIGIWKNFLGVVERDRHEQFDACLLDRC